MVRGFTGKGKSSSKKASRSKAETVTVTVKTVQTTAAPNGATEALVQSLAPTPGALGTNFASLAAFISMYELCKIDWVVVRTVPAPTPGSSVFPPWILGFTPFGGTAPGTAAAFESTKSSKLATPFVANNVGVIQTSVLEEQCCTIRLVAGDFTILESGGPNGFLATNGLGTQNSFGNIYMAAMTNFSTAGTVSQVEITMTFRDIYDPLQLRTMLRQEFSLGNAYDRGTVAEQAAADESSEGNATAGPPGVVTQGGKMDFTIPLPSTPPSATPWSGNQADLKKLQDQLDLLRVNLGAAYLTG